MPALTYSARVQAAARASYISLSIVLHRSFSTPRPARQHDHFHRSDHSSHGWSSIYDSGPTKGPLKDASSLGVPETTPRILKDHLDQYVVGQDRAKRILSVAIYNHYQRAQELDRQEQEHADLLARKSRRDRAAAMAMIHPTEEEFPGQQQTITIWNGSARLSHDGPSTDPPPLAIEKSNILLLGPSGVGKTLMAKTLARTLHVPFSLSDCTPFTQAGYIGEDADVCVHRLLAAANYDVTKAERGIICLDEIDKIASARVSHGKDVSGEGVQQALLKIIEGTTLQIQAKPDKSSRLQNTNGAMNPQIAKPETYSVRTDNILFICTGAFVGLHKTILDRVSKASIGFGATVRGSRDLSSHETTLQADVAFFKTHLPYYNSAVSTKGQNDAVEQEQNVLDLVGPADLHAFGLIPELVGRLPVSCALSALDTPSLVKVLTEPRNSLLRQYEQLFQLSSIELRFTSGALQLVAESAHKMGTGARGLRTVMERLLSDAMFETPGSDVRFVAVTAQVARRQSPALYFYRDGKAQFLDLLAREEEAWEVSREKAVETDIERRARVSRTGGSGAATTFEEYRQKTTLAGAG